mmetsp:Transcript_19203/g.31892  ORF Transcript_19203/g.31892 Transcript_19203/m.31892 type:complete len:184 (+) Transcript_19203:37-588(+)|eukprot:CAMPEP_0119014796 /NCGR_PEP_ID=MMETSP1176-20130426/10396_1 /TAXON_ID=265551 /ORGANISM="Synedropsis recta cf, Strain CCMP1620" /LENGTH=183 /DNA_ID=CAMNT_0006968039 /DNA_START=20 /DNA_END=571 /DNA_ORIENTATION=+
MLSSKALFVTRATTSAAARLCATVQPFSSVTPFSGHSLNCEHALKKANAGESFAELSEGSVQIFQGIGPKHTEAFDQLGIRSIHDLANYKFYHMAKAITVLKESESESRPEESKMNISKAVDKAYETKSLKEISEAPVAALMGLSDEKGALFRTFGVTTVADLAGLKYCKWAESIVALSKYEE